MSEFWLETHPIHSYLHNIKFACPHISDPHDNSNVYSPFYACAIFLEFDKRDFRKKSQRDKWKTVCLRGLNWDGSMA